MYKILVPTDFSACATFAEDLALSIAKKVEGEVHFYHRAAIPHNWKDITENDKNRFPEIWDEVRSTELNLQRCMVKAKEKQVNSKRVYSHGKLIENVIDYVDTFDIDLIVKG